MKKINIKKYVSAGILLATMTTGFAVAIPAFADTNIPVANTRHVNSNGGKRGMMRPSVLGTVSAINGTIITVSGRQGFGTTTPTTTFTVDATNAKITKNNTAGTIASIAVGDTILAQGTVNGTTLTATIIRDGALPTRGIGAEMGGGKRNGMMGQSGDNATPEKVFGDGQPVVAGTVSAVNGTTLTITNKSNVTYTVNTANAKIIGGQSGTATLSNVTVGDMVIVQGAVNGTTITATSIVDQTKPIGGTSNTTTQTPRKGMFGEIGSFFGHMFGF